MRYITLVRRPVPEPDSIDDLTADLAGQLDILAFFVGALNAVAGAQA